MNPVIASITLRSMLGRTRSLLLLLLPATLVALAVGLRLADFSGPAIAAQVLRLYAFTVVLPLVTLIVGTGVLGAEVEDGTIVYLLSKPVPRPVVTLTKLVVAVGAGALLTAVPTLVAGLVLTGFRGGVAVAAAVGTLVASLAYCALFVAVSVTVRHALAVGLVYVLVWEGLVGGFVDGAKLLSVQAWAMSVSDRLAAAPQVRSYVGLAPAVALLAAVTFVAAVLTDRRLRSLSITTAE